MEVTTILLIFSLSIFVHAQELKYRLLIKNVADNDTSTIDDNWWRNAIFYQIYPRSFMDSNKDGMGDLQGITNKLDHLQDMGVTAAWLSPIYKSPGVDQGYDISDYTDIDPIFGTLTDLEVLVNKAHDLGIKIIMDFVPNHTSDQHKWFQLSVQGIAPYDNYYIWRGSKKNEVPNNWLSVFGDSAWTWNENRSSFYLHQFASAQPDLNFRNPYVVKEMKDVLQYWLDFGIDGFRIDAVPFIFEDEDFKDEPLSGAAGVDEKQYGYLKHIYTTNLDETYNLIYEFRSVLDDYNNNTQNLNYSRVMMTEAYTDTSEQTVRYYGNSSTNGAHFTFNFNLITDISGNFTTDNLISTINKWLSHLDKKYVSNWVLGNHDQHRVATRLGVENVDALNMLTAFLPGVQVTYMGEEIGMENGDVTCDQGYDPQAIKNCSTFNDTSRDFERTPFQWDDTDNAGFSESNSTWLPVSDKYKLTNLKAQNVAGLKSHYNVYKAMVNLRKKFTSLSYDALSLIKISDQVVQIVRNTDLGEYSYLFNSGDGTEEVHVYNDGANYEVLVTSVNSKNSVGGLLSNQTITLQPHESIILGPTDKSGSNSIISTFILCFLSVIFLALFY